MKKILRNLLILSVFLTSPTFGTEACPLPELKDTPANSAACYFYRGTSAFREARYAQAAIYWKALIGLKSVAVEEEHLKISAYNNLGYLYFYGKGVEPNKKAAIEYWGFAMKSGNEEAAYHLCHAHADSKEATYNPKIALGYCKEGLRRYGLLKERGPELEEIVAQLKAYVRKLEKR